MQFRPLDFARELTRSVVKISGVLAATALFGGRENEVL
jgi:hypothetical protein